MPKRRREIRKEVEWEFLTFPVFFAFLAGVFVTGFLTYASGGLLFYPLFLISLLGVSFGLAHTLTHHLARSRAARRREKEDEEERERAALEVRAARDEVAHRIRPRRRRRA